MTREEIEELVRAEVDRKIGTIVAQIGKDLADQYATVEDVQQLIDHRAKLELAAVGAAWDQAARALTTETDLPEEHPLYELLRLVNDFTDLQIRVNMLSLYIVTMNKLDERGETGPARLEQVLKLARIKHFVSDLEHNNLLDWVEEADERCMDGREIVKDLISVLGPRPKMETDD